TTGAQTFNDPVTVATGKGPATDFTSTGAGNVTFASTLSGGGLVRVNTTGTTAFDGAVSVGSLATDAGGTTDVNGGTVTTTGDQPYGDAVVLTADATHTGV